MAFTGGPQTILDPWLRLREIRSDVDDRTIGRSPWVKNIATAAAVKRLQSPFAYCIGIGNDNAHPRIVIIRQRSTLTVGETVGGDSVSTTLGTLCSQVRCVEGFSITIDGEREDGWLADEAFPSYQPRYRRPCSGDLTVAEWLRRRLASVIRRRTVRVLDGEGQPVRASSKLRTVRDSYARAVPPLDGRLKPLPLTHEQRARLQGLQASFETQARSLHPHYRDTSANVNSAWVYFSISGDLVAYVEFALGYWGWGGGDDASDDIVDGFDAIDGDGGDLAAIAQKVVSEQNGPPEDLDPDWNTAGLLVVDEFKVEEDWLGLGLEPMLLSLALLHPPWNLNFIVAAAPQPLNGCSDDWALMCRGREEHFKAVGFAPYRDQVWVLGEAGPPLREAVARWQGELGLWSVDSAESTA